MSGIRTPLLVSFFIMALVANIYWSVEKARDPWISDIAVLYGAAHIILDPEVPNTAVYDAQKMHETYSRHVWEKSVDDKSVDYIYSLATAYIFTPIAWLSYENAKIVWNLTSLLFYLTGVFITLKLGRAGGLHIIIMLTISLAFTPLLFNQWFIQINTLLFFLVALTALAASRNFPVISGLILGIASLFKLFPIALALALGLKNWRITAACAATFGISLLIPGSLEWFPSVSVIYPHYTYIFLWLNQFGLVWFIAYVFLVAILTAFIIWVRAASYLEIVALTIPAVFLVMPIVEIHHLTLLMFTYAYLLADPARLSPVSKAIVVGSFLIISVFFNLKLSFVLSAGLFMLWAAAAWSGGSDKHCIFKQEKRAHSAPSARAFRYFFP